MTSPRYWQHHGNSQEINNGGSGVSHGYPALYKANTLQSAVDLEYRQNTGLVQWIADQPTVLAALKTTGTNIVSLRPWACGTASFNSDYGGNISTWQSALETFLGTYMAANCFVLLLTSCASSAQFNVIRAQMDPIIRTWVGTYCHAIADIAATSQLGPDAQLSDATYFDGTGHWTDAAQDIVESLIRPKLDLRIHPRKRFCSFI